MIRHLLPPVAFCQKLLIATSILIAIPSAFAQTNSTSPTAPDWQTSAGPPLSFDVATIRPTQPDTLVPSISDMGFDDAYRPSAGIFSHNAPLLSYIEYAYKTRLSPEFRESILPHLPKWVATEKFAIYAKAPGNPTKNQMRLMMQSLLADRFKLKVHFENQQHLVLALTLLKPGKLGPKLHPHAEGPSCSQADQSTEQSPFTCGRFNLIPEANGLAVWGSRNATLAMIATYLPALPPKTLTRPYVVDQTGLTGAFDFAIEWQWMPAPAATPDAQSEAQGPTLEEALEEQLGIKLKPTTATIPILVIDHVEPPSPN